MRLLSRNIRISGVLTAALGLHALLLSAGCATRSPDPRLYDFALRDGWRAAAARTAKESRFVVRIGPVRLPVYLDRPHMVTRVSDNEIIINDGHRWGIPLDVAVLELLAGTMARALPEAYITDSTHPPEPGEGVGVHVEIIRLDGVRGGTVELVAQWRMVPLDTPGQPLAQQLGHYKAETADTGFEAYVEAVRSVITALGNDIAGPLHDR